MYTYFDKEDPDYSDEAAAKYRSIDIDQLLGQAAARGLITADEQADPSSIEEPRRSEVLAQATMESVVALQLDARRKKAGEATAKGEESVKSPPGTPAGGAPIGTPAGATPLDMAVLLKDFPKNAAEVDALLKVGGELNGVFLIEEVFGRDIDNSDEEDEINAKRELDILGPVPEVEEGAEVPPREKLFKGLKHRADQFEKLVTINRVAKKAGKDFIVKRVPF